MQTPFVPDDFAVPLRLEQARYVLLPLTPEHVEKDYDAVMSSRESLRTIFPGEGDWPAESMTLEENYGDLERHQTDFAERRGFTYTVETPQGDRCLGCVYIYPTDIYPTGRGDYDAQVYYWVRDSERAWGMDEALGCVLRQWLSDAWPFQNPAFPGRDVPFAAWEALQKLEP